MQEEVLMPLVITKGECGKQSNISHVGVGVMVTPQVPLNLSSLLRFINDI